MTEFLTTPWPYVIAGALVVLLAVLKKHRQSRRTPEGPRFKRWLRPTNDELRAMGSTYAPPQDSVLAVTGVIVDPAGLAILPGKRSACLVLTDTELIEVELSNIKPFRLRSIHQRLPRADVAISDARSSGIWDRFTLTIAGESHVYQSPKTYRDGTQQFIKAMS